MNRDGIIKMAAEACDPNTVCARDGGWWTLKQEELERFFHAAYAAGAMSERERIEAERRPHIYSPLHIMNGCPVCRMGANGRAMGYACARFDCPTRATCTGAV